MMGKFSSVKGQYVYVEVDGIEHKVYFEENGQGIPLVCQHTAGADSRQWRDLLEDSNITQNFRVIAYDLPRHGKSDPLMVWNGGKKNTSLQQIFIFNLFLISVRLWS